MANATRDMVESNEPVGFLRLFRLISAARDGASSLQLMDLVRLMDMALMQTALDWDGLDAEDLDERAFLNLIREKQQVVHQTHIHAVSN
ncbi:hypothetical protein [Rhizobium sp. WYJ-E13]|uniref:hypothetical protein n=1 Tax=unclassified Rhizobium TaxID=2613769 RepID=UPI001C1ED237|nr:hypothetical protein [Rhizobium sp. WYJ-E13]QWW71031.1 hypothetical protein KQ933_30060 [Rhizobium sp. WYJ-E13]